MWQRMRDTLKDIIHPELGPIRLWLNDRYAAGLRAEPFGAHITIANLDGSDNHNWREFQRIKNDIAGEQFDAVEIYPAEDRLVDTANTFHLWVFHDRLPFGFNNRAVSVGVSSIPGSKQTQADFEDRPADCIDLSNCGSVAEAMALLPPLL